MKGNGVLLAGILVVGGIYLYKRSKQATPPFMLPPGSPVSEPGTAVNVQATQVAPASLMSAGSSLDPTVYATVSKWGQGVGTPPVLAFVQSAVPIEFSGMYDIITNYWQTGKTLTKTQIDFWNNLRAKYDPSHKYW